MKHRLLKKFSADLILVLDLYVFPLAPKELSDIVTAYQQRKPEKLDDLDQINEHGGVEGILSLVQANPLKGLENNDIAERRAYFGTNMRAPHKIRGFCEIIWDALGDTLLRVLLCCGIISIAIDESVDDEKSIGIVLCSYMYSMDRRFWNDFCCFHLCPRNVS